MFIRLFWSCDPGFSKSNVTCLVCHQFGSEHAVCSSPLHKQEKSNLTVFILFRFRDIPVDMKYIADPSMHSMPAVTLSPNQKWLACQSMDNKVVIFSAINRFKFHRKKTFKGHMVAGYACGIDFSPEMRQVSLNFKHLDGTMVNFFVRELISGQL